MRYFLVSEREETRGFVRDGNFVEKLRGEGYHIKELSTSSVYNGLLNIATGYVWGKEYTEIVRNKLNFLFKLHEVSSRKGLVRPKEKKHPQFGIRYSSGEGTPEFDFANSWAKGQSYRAILNLLERKPEKGRKFFNELNSRRGNVPFRSARELEIEAQRHESQAMQMLEDGINTGKVLNLICNTVKD